MELLAVSVLPAGTEVLRPAKSAGLRMTKLRVG